MARSMQADSTDIFRQKVTREGVVASGRWYKDPREGEPYKVVTCYGPFATRNVGGNPWMNPDDTKMLIEIQKLQPAEGGDLEWVTEKLKIVEREPADVPS